jgi:Multiubiquitin
LGKDLEGTGKMAENHENDGDQGEGEAHNHHSEHHHHPEHHHPHEAEIVVNGKEKHWAKEQIDYDELVKLSGEPLPPGPDPGFTITYFDGPREKPEGSVTPRHSVKVKAGMVFNVTPTNRS